MLYTSSDQTLSLQAPGWVTEIHSSPTRWPQVFPSHYPISIYPPACCFLFWDLLHVHTTFPAGSSWLQPLECCIAIKHSIPKTCGIHNQLQRSSELPKSMGSALLLKLHLSPFWQLVPGATLSAMAPSWHGRAQPCLHHRGNSFLSAALPSICQVLEWENLVLQVR